MRTQTYEKGGRARTREGGKKIKAKRKRKVPTENDEAMIILGRNDELVTTTPDDRWYKCHLGTIPNLVRGCIIELQRLFISRLRFATI